MRVDNAPTEFGKFRTRQDVVTPTPQATSRSFRTFNGRWGTMTLAWWRNQALGYGDGIMPAGGTKSISVGLNDFGLEDGQLSHFLPDNEVEVDSWPIALQSILCTEVRVRDIENDDGTITTKKQEVTFNRYEAFAETMSEALAFVDQMVGKTDYAISSFTTTTGDRMYRVTGRSKPVTFGAWIDV